MNPMHWLQTHRTAALGAGAVGVVGLALHAKHKGGGGASSSAGTTSTPPVSQQGVPTYNSSGTDSANALLDIDSRLSQLQGGQRDITNQLGGIGTTLNGLDPGNGKAPGGTAPKPIAKPTPKPKPKPSPKPKPGPPAKPKPKPAPKKPAPKPPTHKPAPKPPPPPAHKPAPAPHRPVTYVQGNGGKMLA